MKNRIGLLGPVIRGNLGNAALEAAVVQRLARTFPEAHFYVSTGDSIEGLKSYGVRLFPLHRRVHEDFFSDVAAPQPNLAHPDKGSVLRRLLKRVPLLRAAVLKMRSLRRQCRAVTGEIVFWIRSYAVAKQFRYLIVCGGGQLDDLWGGAWGLPYSLFTWALLAKLAGCPFIVLSVGAERIDSRVGRFLLRHTLRLAKYRSYRDFHSKQIAEQLGSAGKQSVYPDLAFSLDLPRTTCRTRDKVSRVVGVGPIAYCDPRVWPVKDAARYNGYLRTLASFVAYLIQMEWRVVLFASQMSMDIRAIEDVKNLLLKRGLEPTGSVLLERPIKSLKHLLTFLPHLDVVVASRLHSCLLATLVGTPVLAVSHEMKVTALMSDLGVGEYCVSIDRLEVEALVERFRLLQHQLPRVRVQIAGRVREYRQSLEEQYRLVFGPISAETMASYGDANNKSNRRSVLESM